MRDGRDDSRGTEPRPSPEETRARLRTFFAAHGPLARQLGHGYEPRPQQAAMAETVLDALQHDGVALIEAGTGTGKTVAYLVPAALHGGRTVISTHTRNLQDQIATKDAPLVESALGRPLGLMVMKGLSNYLCRRRLDAYLASVAALLDTDRRLADLVEWARTTETGERSEIPWLADDDAIWREVSSGADVRLGYKCPRFDTCFVTRMRRRAAESRMLVVNHHLFFADLAVPEEAPSRVLPEWDAVVFDEAHDLEDAAAGFFGVRVSSRRIELLRGDVGRRVQSLGLGGKRIKGKARAVVLDQLDDAVADLARLGERLAELAGGGGESDGAGRRAPLGGAVRADTVVALYHAADNSLGTLGRRLDEMGKSDDELGLLAGRCEALRADLADVMAGDDEGHVAWLDAPFRGGWPGASMIRPSARPERWPGRAPAVDSGVGEEGFVLEDVGGEGRPPRWRRVKAGPSTRFARSGQAGGGDSRPRMPPGLALGRTPLDVAGILREKLFARGDPVVFTSATLADHRGFGFVRGRFGIPEDAVERKLDSPFDFPTQALLYVPEDLPEPGVGEAFREAMLEQTRALLGVTGGGALLLYTSFRNQRWMADRLRAEGWKDLLVQGEAPRNMLLERLRAERNAVLLATASFWQGVDVAGEALRLVVIDKLPFEVPNDPLTNARIERIKRLGGHAFNDYQVPVAAIALRQGFGRLIRTRRDRGIVAILDVRLRTRSYGRSFLAALPRCAGASRMDDVAKWWTAEAGGTGKKETADGHR
ncbi:MAG: ATP-dependent DNA helicase [Deltaproteobacteria bacterium]|nr:ATP-dependent DNA helicase [Deltaproteobacteria bacterium]